MADDGLTSKIDRVTDYISDTLDVGGRLDSIAGYMPTGIKDQFGEICDTALLGLGVGGASVYIATMILHSSSMEKAIGLLALSLGTYAIGSGLGRVLTKAINGHRQAENLQLQANHTAQLKRLNDRESDNGFRATYRGLRMPNPVIPYRPLLL